MSRAILRTLFAKNTWANAELHLAVAETDLWFESYLAGVTADALAQSRVFRFTDGDARRRGE